MVNGNGKCVMALIYAILLELVILYRYNQTLPFTVFAAESVCFNGN